LAVMEKKKFNDIVTGKDLGLVSIDELSVGSPTVVVGGVAESNAD